MNVPITLAMTVTAENLSFLWKRLSLGCAGRMFGASFSPMFTSGRVPLSREHER